MAGVRVYYDEDGKTVTVWFGNPQQEHVCEEIGNDVVLIKDKSGSVIGFERLNFAMEKGRDGFSFEATAV